MVCFLAKIYSVLFVLLLVIGAQRFALAEEIVLNGASCSLEVKTKAVCHAPSRILALELQDLYEGQEKKHKNPPLLTLKQLEHFRVQSERSRQEIESARLGAEQERIFFGYDAKEQEYVAQLAMYTKGLKRYNSHCAHYKTSLKKFMKKHPSLRPVRSHRHQRVVRRKKIEEYRPFPSFPDS